MSMKTATEPERSVEGVELSAAAQAACLRIDPSTRRQAAARLRSAKGHLEAVLRMLEDPNSYCVDVLKQLKGVQGALSKVNTAVLRSHIRDHVATASQRGDVDPIVDELLDALKYRD